MLKPAWALLLMATILMGNTHAKSPPTKTAHVGQIKFLQGSEETTKERSSRLKRECKGGVNAGACAGYTR